MRYKLLALDLDGTILDSHGVLRPAVAQAVGDARARGVRVVLCTGRRYRTTRPILEQLGLSGPTVVQNGVLVKDAATGRTLRGSYVDPSAYTGALDALRRALGPPAVYVDEGPDSEFDLVAERGSDHHPFLAEYLDANADQTRWVDSLAAPPSQAVTMISAMAERGALEAVDRSIASATVRAIRTNLIQNKSYRGDILEIVSSDTGKWHRLREIAASEDIEDGEIVAIGDDTNDREMIERAGLGIAMGNAHAEVREVADHVTASNDDDGAARAIRELLL